MLEWTLWQSLLEVTRQGTYRDAARVLKIDPTTIGRKIKRIEQHLQVTSSVDTNIDKHCVEHEIITWLLRLFTVALAPFAL